jgi:hypothetical protein
MPIPREILDVPRPKNTVVIAYGSDKKLYAVRQRVGCRNVGGRHLPVNGPTIGHIVDGSYVPIAKSAPQDVSFSPIDLRIGPVSSSATNCLKVSRTNCLPYTASVTQ